MRKFTAFITAIVLAVILVSAIMAFRGGASTNDIKLLWLNLFGKNDISSVKTDVPVDIKPDENLSYDERIKKGDYYFDRGFLTFASNEYVKASNLNPNLIEPYKKLLVTNLNLGDYNKASRNAEIILAKNPSDSETKLLLAQIYIKQSSFEIAENTLKSIIKSDSPDPRIYYYMGLLRIVFDDNNEAHTYFEKAKSINTTPELDKKIDYFLDAYTEFDFAQASEDLYLSELLSRAFNKAGEYEMVIYKLKTVLKTRSDLRDAWILFGFAYLNLEKYYFAESAFNKAYELDSEWPTTQYFLGLTHAELGNIDEAIIYYNNALSNNFEPKAVIYTKIAELYLDTKNYTKAVEYYEKLLELNNEDINSFVRPIWIYIDFLNQPTNALKLAELAAITFPDSAMSYNLLGWSQTAAGDYTNSEENLKKSIQINPNQAAPYLNLGKLYEVQNLNTMAIENYQKAYELDQNGSIGNIAAQKYNTLKKASNSDL